MLKSWLKALGNWYPRRKKSRLGGGAELSSEDADVPEELFEMVAVVLSWAYWIKSQTPD